jgi:hypothetical protein
MFALIKVDIGLNLSKGQRVGLCDGIITIELALKKAL